MTYFDSGTETLPREQLAALQLEKFQAMSRELWGRNRFYTDKWKAAGAEPGDIRSLADLAKLPLTTKHELMQDQAAHGPFGHNLTYPLEQYVRFHQTSGTTGVPLKVPDTEAGWQWWGRCWGHVLAGAGVTYVSDFDKQITALENETVHEVGQATVKLELTVQNQAKKATRKKGGQA